MGAITRALTGFQTDLVRVLEQLSARLKSSSPQNVATHELELLGEEEEPLNKEVEILPPLPKGISPSLTVADFQKPGKIWEIIRNPALNPHGKDPDSLERVEILRELIRAKAQINMLRADVQVALAEARLVLAEEGEYIDYAPGEPYLRVADTVTLGEPTQNGKTRMYYMHAADFPEIHEKRAEQKTIADRAIRRIATILQ